jgi:hypothetical protein
VSLNYEPAPDRFLVRRIKPTRRNGPIGE